MNGYFLLIVLIVSLSPMKGFILQFRIISAPVLIHLIYFFSYWFIQRKMAGSSPHSANLFSRITDGATGENSNTPLPQLLHTFLQIDLKSTEGSSLFSSADRG